MNPFDVLEIAPGASFEATKAAYHRLAKQWHPDRFAGAEKAYAENRFRMLAEAFNVLKDQNRRTELERVLPVAPREAVLQAPSPGTRPLSERTAEDWFQDAKDAFASNDFARALGLVHYCLRVDADRAEAYVLLSQVLEAGGGDKRALVKALEQAIRLNPLDADSMIRLADVLQSLGMRARAVRLRESAGGIAPNHKAFRQNVAKAPLPASAGDGLMDQLRTLTGRLFKRG